MEELFGAKVEYKEAVALADLVSIRQDLIFSRDSLMRLRPLIKEDSRDYILIQRIGEFLLGMRFNRDKSISQLKKDQRNWDWFYDNFM